MVESETIQIDWSREAAVEISGQWYPAFQMNSYIANVTFPDGFTATIVLPPGACQKGQAHYFDRVLANAAIMHMDGVKKGFMTDPPPIKLPHPARTG
jgi:hypothetical protein